MRYQRTDVEFRSRKEMCRAWLYMPENRPVPCIVMAHGFAGTRDAGLEPYAHRFAEAGFAVLLFDYRHFGASDGDPRQLLSAGRQCQDWESAIDYGRRIPGVDGTRIALWGTSFSAGSVIVAAARDPAISAVCAQNPMLDMLPAVLMSVRFGGVKTALKKLGLGVLDRIRSVFGFSPVYIPVVAPPGRMAALPSPDAMAGYRAVVPPHWRNEICARLALTAAFNRPIVHVGNIQCPVLLQACRRDAIVSFDAALAAAARLGTKAELKVYDCGHFDIYVGGNFERASGEQVEFFKRALLDGAD